MKKNILSKWFENLGIVVSGVSIAHAGEWPLIAVFVRLLAGGALMFLGFMLGRQQTEKKEK